MTGATITLDIDWAPDHAIDDAAAQLVDAGVRATWFVTHASPAIDRLRERPELFELGIHPNFAPGSSHGDSPEAVLDHCMALVPEARTMRTHGLVQSTALLTLVRERTPVRVDASLFLPGATHVEPLVYPLAGGVLTRVPYVWEDDAEFLAPVPRWNTWSVAQRVAGPAVFDFHPIHVALNSSSPRAYEQLKGRGLESCTRSDVAGLREAGEGAATAFSQLVEALAGHGGGLVAEVAA